MSTEALPSAAVTLEEIVAKDPSTALYLPVAERLLARGHVAQAILLCEERRSRPGKGIGDHIVLGRCYLADGRLAQAQDEFRAALQLDRENVVALKSMAGILSHEGRHAEAADLYRAVCRVDPGDLESQSALHQITSGEYAEVRPPEVIVSQTDVGWQPVRLNREEDHLSELGLGLPTFDSLDAPARAPSGMRISGPSELPAEPILTPEELSIGPSFPRERDVERPAAPAKSDAVGTVAASAASPKSRHEIIPAPDMKPGEELHDRLSALDGEEFQSTALERLEVALKPAAARPLGEVAGVEDVAIERPAVRAEAPSEAIDETIELPASALIDVDASDEPTPATRRSAVWRDESAPRPVQPRPVEPRPFEPRPRSAAPPTPAEQVVSAPPEPVAGHPKVEGNRSAFETWLRRLGGNQ